MNEWEKFLQEGVQYLNAGVGKKGKPSKLTADIRYNLLALSLEKSMMGIIMYHGDLADNHTFSDLLMSLEKHVYVPPTLRDEISSLEQVQSICNVYEYHRELPSESVVKRMVAVAEYLIACAADVCGTSEPETVTTPGVQ